MATNTRIEYTDGTGTDTTVTLFHRMASEKYAVAHGWGGGLDSSVRQMSYAAYFSLRQAQQLPTPGMSFDAWAATVDHIGDPDENSTETPQSTGPTPLANGTEPAFASSASPSPAVSAALPGNGGTTPNRTNAI